MTEVRDLLTLLAERVEGFSVRDEQVWLAEYVADRLREGHHGLVDAPPGVGKSLGYLAPAVAFALEHGRRVLVSTHTIALQDQLIARDVPTLQRVLDFDARVLKGRARYVCLNRLDEVEDGDVDHPSEDAELRRWAKRTKTGDMAEAEVGAWARSRYTVGPDACLRHRCGSYGSCWAERARLKAKGADLTIVNHALLLSMLLKRDAWTDLLPADAIVIVDEAHALAEVARQTFGYEVKPSAVGWVAAKAGKAGARRVVARLREASGPFFDALDRLAEEDAGALASVEHRPLLAALDEAERALTNLADARGDGSLFVAADRARMLAEQVEEAFERRSGDRVYFVANGALVARQLSVAVPLRETLFGKQAVIACSATLAAGESFADYVWQTGHRSNYNALLPSPFDLSSQLLLVVPRTVPHVTAKSHMPKLIVAVRAVIEQLPPGTGALVLFNSLVRLRTVADALGEEVDGHPILVQGRADNAVLLARFRDEESSVLLGSRSFFAGVDIPGRSLSAVVLESLPFAHRGDVVGQALALQAQAQGYDPWVTTIMPPAVRIFRQAVGRGVRSLTDRAVVVCLDQRITKPQFATFFLADLTEVPLTNDLAAIGPFLAAEERVAALEVEAEEIVLARRDLLAESLADAERDDLSEEEREVLQAEASSLAVEVGESEGLLAALRDPDVRRALWSAPVLP